MPTAPTLGSPIRLATVGVEDLDRARGFLESAFGWVLHTPSPTDVPRDLLDLWQAPADVAARSVIVGPADATWGLVRLVEPAPVGRSIRGGYERVQDRGHYALNVRVADIEVAWERMLAAGARAKSAPTWWRVNEELAATDSQSFDPDGVLWDVFQIHGDGLGSLAGESSALQTMAIRVADAPASARFYGAFGFTTLYDRRIDDLGEFFHTPDDVVMHNVNLHMPDVHRDARIELAALEGLPGPSLGALSVPPNIGMWSITFLTDDLRASREAVIAHGGTVVAEPVRLEVEGIGAVQAMYVHGPDGEAIELLQTTTA